MSARRDGQVDSPDDSCDDCAWRRSDFRAEQDRLSSAWTGYRPIRDAAPSIGPAPDDGVRQRLAHQSRRFMDMDRLSDTSRNREFDAVCDRARRSTNAGQGYDSV